MYGLMFFKVAVKGTIIGIALFHALSIYIDKKAEKDAKRGVQEIIEKVWGPQK